jgi:2-polyprenyl-6-methoxyphenol hydroxylase-like FAD-dependent oxidoreductase
MTSEPIKQVRIIGGGPAGLLLGCLLRDQDVNVTIVEKRTGRTRERRVKLSEQVLLSQKTNDGIYLFSESQTNERQSAITAMQPDLTDLIRRWIQFSTPIKDIQNELLAYFFRTRDSEARGTFLTGVEERVSEQLNTLRTNFPNSLVVDCMGFHSVLRDAIQQNNYIGDVVEKVLLCTFMLRDPYEFSELCKYYKNIGIKRYAVIPATHETYTTAERQTYVTCIITIENEGVFERLRDSRDITYSHLLIDHKPIYDDLNQFLRNLTGNELQRVRLETMEFVALPSNLYRSKKLA